MRDRDKPWLSGQVFHEFLHLVSRAKGLGAHLSRPVDERGFRLSYHRVVRAQSPDLRDIHRAIMALEKEVGERDAIRPNPVKEAA